MADTDEEFQGAENEGSLQPPLISDQVNLFAVLVWVFFGLSE